MLPYCDGDVSDQQGQHFYADSRDAFPDDDVLRSNVWVMGADHNFFNSQWTPPSPGGSDDWSSTADAVCGTSAAALASGKNIRLTAAQQYQVGAAYISRLLRGDPRRPDPVPGPVRRLRAGAAVGGRLRRRPYDRAAAGLGTAGPRLVQDDQPAHRHHVDGHGDGLRQQVRAYRSAAVPALHQPGEHAHQPATPALDTGVVRPERAAERDDAPDVDGGDRSPRGDARGQRAERLSLRRAERRHVAGRECHHRHGHDTECGRRVGTHMEQSGVGPQPVGRHQDAA